ncbi:MAG TPA: ADP-dependent glucokinase/phosphofructokinase [bacterium]|jgi:ADP-dependent phosphofructokinase/glucokinase|nr:ADP-dependent glucokinase/phosphofructokinase [bacterium]
MDLKQTWLRHYSVVPAHLESLASVEGVASVFNANIDAVLKVQPAMLARWMEELGADEWQVLNKGSKRISEPVDVLRGFVECFSKGVAQEWLVSGEATYAWMRGHLGYDRMQMGGQGGIIANVMAVAGVKQVYVHCASLPAQQAGLFLDRPGLLSTGSSGALAPASGIDRSGDGPLIHWILEFDKGAELTLGGLSLVCPKSNRFIATYDPLNFRLAVDAPFDAALRLPANPLNVILMSGFQMLTEPLEGGHPGSGLERIHATWAQVCAWKEAHPGVVVHFEFASTQDLKIRSELAEFLVPKVDSVGCNEQELIGVLEALGESEAAREAQDLGAVSLFKGLLKVYERLRLKRVQLHMFGLYVTLIRPEARSGGPTFDAKANRDGMVFAATLAATKAGTGSLENPETLLWAHGREVSDHSLAELKALAEHLRAAHGVEGLADSGLASTPGFEVVAVPTILIEKPVTLVGMGDTISSLSLVGLH